MPRQAITFIFALLGAMLLMRSCTPKPPAVPDLVAESVPTPAKDAPELRDAASGTVVTFAADGTVATVRRGDGVLVTGAPNDRRPLGFNWRDETRGTHRIPLKLWEAEPSESGLRFVAKQGERVFEREVVLEPGGAGLRCTIRVRDPQQKVRGIELTAASGVPLTVDGKADAAGAAWRIQGAATRLQTARLLGDERKRRYEQLAKDRAEERPIPARPLVHVRQTLDADQQVAFVGILGAQAYVAIEGVARAEALNADVYRIDREGTATDAVETWISLSVAEGAFEETFALRWTPRANLAAAKPQFDPDGRILAQSKELVIETETFKATFSDRGASLVELWLKKFSTDADRAPSPDTWIPMIRRATAVGDRPFTLRVGSPDAVGADPAQAFWKVAAIDEANRKITFVLETKRGYRFRKSITIPNAEGDYALIADVAITKPPGSKEDAASFWFVGPAGSYVEDAYLTSFRERPAGILVERRGGDTEAEEFESIKDETLSKTYGDSRGLLRAVAVRGSYFVCALLTEERSDSQGRPVGVVTEAAVRAIELEKEVPHADGKTSRSSVLGQVACAIPYGTDRIAAHQFRLYAGPNRTEDLEPVQLEETIDFGFFSAIGRGLMWLMKFLAGILGSYGIAIVLMTLIVRALLMPISYRTQVGMQKYSKKIQKIKPILDGLEKKFGNNKQKLAQERMKVMREHGVGFPLGCLMMFFQIPIWFALFQALRVEFALRHQPFLWANDMSMPDQLFGLPFWPHWFNLLPILMLVLWVAQQKLAPTPGGNDPNMKTQMKMMKYMPYMFFLFLYQYAAALAIYMCVSSAWSIGESKFVRKAIAKLD